MIDARTKDGDAALTEIRKVHETADHLARGDTPEEADQVRVLAGLVSQLAEQVERLVTPAAAQTTSNASADPDTIRHDREVTLEEDRTPEDAPAEPLDDRAES